MSKKIRIEDTPEFKYFEEHQDEILKELEEDEKVKDLEIPEEWDIAFKQTIQDTFEEKRRAKKRRIRKILVAVTTFFVVAGFGTNYTLVRVEGVGLVDLIEKVFSKGTDKHTIYSSSTDMYDMVPDDEDKDIYFNGDTLENVLDEVRNEIKMPMFYLDDILDGFYVNEAKYNRLFNLLNIELWDGDRYIYIVQEQITDEGARGMVGKPNELDKIENSNLQQEVIIYRGMQDDSLWFSVEISNIIFTLDGEVTLEECKQLAENLQFR